MRRLSRSPTDPVFVQNPYPFYDHARAEGDLVRWEDYGLICAVTHAAVAFFLKDRRFGRAAPEGSEPAVPDHLASFYAVEAHSMLELEPPRHTRLRGLVLRAFTSRRIAALAPEIAAVSHTLIDLFPEGPFDLLPAFARKLPVIIIARLLGVPEDMADDLLTWSNAMVGMYQARRTREDEDRAVAATQAFVAFMHRYVAEKRDRPADDLITHLIAAEEDGEKLSTDELIATCIVLLNAGHEATVHMLGNGTKTLLDTGAHSVITPDVIEEILRFDPALHMFVRWAYETVTVFGHTFRRGDRVACLLGAAGRDPAVFAVPHRFDPTRPVKSHMAFGAGIHFCVGAPLARLELMIGLRTLFARCPGLRLTAPPRYANVYHFHGLERLMVTR